MGKNRKIDVKGISITTYQQKDSDFISLTDIARHRDSERSDYILQNWMRNRSTIEFMGLWERFNNPDFNSIEFDGIKNASGSNSFSLTPKKWIEQTNAIGIVSITGRYGGNQPTRDHGKYRFLKVDSYLHVFLIFLPNSEESSFSMDDLKTGDLIDVYYYKTSNTLKEGINRFAQFIDHNDQPYFIRNGFQKNLGYFVIGLIWVLNALAFVYVRKGKIAW